MNKSGKGGFGDRRHDINLKGRPKGHTPLEELKEAIRLAEKTGSGSLLKRYVDLALTDRTVLIDIMKKLYPNAQSLEISGSVTLQDLMSKLRGEVTEEDMDKTILGEADNGQQDK